jgi:hypothetical protein
LRREGRRPRRIDEAIEGVEPTAEDEKRAVASSVGLRSEEIASKRSYFSEVTKKPLN